MNIFFYLLTWSLVVTITNPCFPWEISLSAQKPKRVILSSQQGSGPFNCYEIMELKICSYKRWNVSLLKGISDSLTMITVTAKMQNSIRLAIDYCIHSIF